MIVADSAQRGGAVAATASNSGWTLGRVVLLALALTALVLLASTPLLIKPFPAQAPWFESAAMFPRVALAIVVIGAIGELFVRRRNVKAGDSDELDSSAAHLPKALAVLVLFLAYSFLVPVLGYLSSTLLFLLLSAAVLRLPLRVNLALAIPLSLVLWGIFKLGLKLAFGHGWLI